MAVGDIQAIEAINPDHASEIEISGKNQDPLRSGAFKLGEPKSVASQRNPNCESALHERHKAESVRIREKTGGCGGRI